jgi:penicillin-binding protein 1A
MSVRWWAFPLLLVFLLVAAGSLVVGFAAVVIYPTLPTLDVLTDYQPKIPLRIYSADGQLIGEFGEERRAVVSLDQVPKNLVDAIVAAEDERFYQHGGVDYVGVARAALSNFASGGVRQGASTITMQVARNFFLTKEKTLTRKFNEMLLAFKIESSLSKQQILELYINQIYLGQRWLSSRLQNMQCLQACPRRHHGSIRSQIRRAQNCASSTYSGACGNSA